MSVGFLWNEERYLFHVGFYFCKEVKDTVLASLELESERCLKAALLFPDLSSLVSVSRLFPDWPLFKSALWDSGKVMEVGVCSLQIRTGGHRKASGLRSPTGSGSVSPLGRQGTEMADT